MKKLFIVILAGGKGERLWPLSRERQPKQLLPFTEGITLLEHTINRVKKLVPTQNLWIVTAENQREHIKNIVGDTVGMILTEPKSCNTAPAILLSTLHIMQIEPDATICFLPADHFIPDETIFIHYLQQAIEIAHRNKNIILLGLKPSFAATGYGYIECDEQINNDTDINYCHVLRFHEKPSLDTAQLYTTLPTMLWNIGICCAQISVLIDQYKKYAPTIAATIDGYLNGINDYSCVPEISVDHAILEKSDCCLVIPAEFVWSDVGNLNTFIALQTQKGNVIQINSENVLVYGTKKLAVLIDVDNICVVETPDVLLVANRKETDKVKQVIGELKKRDYEEYL